MTELSLRVYRVATREGRVLGRPVAIDEFAARRFTQEPLACIAIGIGVLFLVPGALAYAVEQKPDAIVDTITFGRPSK